MGIKKIKVDGGDMVSWCNGLWWFEVSGWSRFTHHARKHAGTHTHTERTRQFLEKKNKGRYRIYKIEFKFFRLFKNLRQF
jgi:glycosyltransferase involved in cell wall biosynthesis